MVPATFTEALNGSTRPDRSVPSRLRVGPFVYEIVLDSRHIDRGNRGEYNGSNLVLRLDPTMPAGRMRVTLLHELFHAVFDAAGHRQGFATADDEAQDKAREAFIDALSPGLLLVLRENPGLVAYLTGED
jgi:hypothetical protein